MSESSARSSGPIQNLDVFDILGVRKDGGIDASIVAAIAIDGTTDTLIALATKVRKYITELTSDSFLKDYPRVAGGDFRIVILCHGPVDVLARALIESLRKEARKHAILLEVENATANGD